MQYILLFSQFLNDETYLIQANLGGTPQKYYWPAMTTK